MFKTELGHGNLQEPLLKIIIKKNKIISLSQVTPTRSTGGASYIHHEEDGFSTATEVHIILDGLFKRQKSIPILFYKVVKFFLSET